MTSMRRSGVHHPLTNRERRPAGPPTAVLAAATTGSSELGTTTPSGVRSGAPPASVPRDVARRGSTGPPGSVLSRVTVSLVTRLFLPGGRARAGAGADRGALATQAGPAPGAVRRAPARAGRGGRLPGR